jgi:phosphopantothenoylcysteine decarboxylase / phosphopantothenate---cysteine ligase
MSAALAGIRLLVSAGPTYEDIDPVRFIGNRSSGKMGFAIAAVAAERGAEVVLVAGPVHMGTPAGVHRIDVRSAAQMHDAVMARLETGQAPCDAYIGAAAVADFTPLAIASNKLKKQPGQDTLVLELVKTRDILAEVAAHVARPRLVVGFAAETDNVAGYARGKLERKGVDLICANRVGIAGGGFESDDNALLVIDRDGERALGPASKTALAGELLDIVAHRLSAGGAG